MWLNDLIEKKKQKKQEHKENMENAHINRPKSITKRRKEERIKKINIMKNYCCINISDFGDFVVVQIQIMAIAIHHVPVLFWARGGGRTENLNKGQIKSQQKKK